jgi:hypothetical protein
MPASSTVFQKLVQIEQELTMALSDFPHQIALDRMKYARGLARLARTQIELDADVSIPVLSDVDEVRRAGL